MSNPSPTDDILALQLSCGNIADKLEIMQERLIRLQEEMSALQEQTTVVWHGVDETPPVGHLWASDGKLVWLLVSGGESIPKGARMVKFWAEVNLPDPPRFVDDDSAAKEDLDKLFIWGA